MTLPKVWTEREGDIPGTIMNEGDWEACVATAYSMALLYGGVKMAQPYTQYQRELIEYYGAAADRDQNLDLTDIKSIQVYGVKLRLPSVWSNAAALARPGVGMCLTGTGSPGGYATGTFGHEVFWIATSTTAGLLYDPLAPAGSAPLVKSVATMAAWARPLSATNSREVKAWEFGPPPATGVKMAIRPVSEEFTTGTGQVGGQFYVDGPGVGTAKWFTQATRVTSIGETTDGLWRVLFYVGGTGQGEYLWMARSKLTPIAGTRSPAAGYAASLPIPPCPPTPPPAVVDCAVAVADAVAPLKQRITELEQAIIDHVEAVTKPEEDLLATTE